MLDTPYYNLYIKFKLIFILYMSKITPPQGQDRTKYKIIITLSLCTIILSTKATIVLELFLKFNFK